MSTENLYSKKIIERIQRMAGEYSVYQLFDDWISMFALSTAQAVHYSEDREKNYLQIAGKHTKERLEQFCELNGILIDAFEDEMADILGYIYMHLELGSNRTGQFFTPYHLCQLMARIAVKNSGNQKIYDCNETSCGAGGNIIAFAEELKRIGKNYQIQMKAVCQDIDIRAVYMTYVQLSYYGIPAKVFQTDTLRDPTGQTSSTGILYTPQYILNYEGLKDGEKIVPENNKR